LVVGLETLEGKVVDFEALVGGLRGRNNRSVADQWVVDTGVRDKVGLELVQINVEGTIEPQGRGDGANDLCDKTVQVLVARARNIEVTSADIVDSFIVDKEGAVRVLNGAVGGKNGVVRLNHGGRHTGSRVYSELELGLLAVLSGKTLKKQSTEARTRATAKGVEDQEALEGVAVVSNAANTINDIVHHLLANGVVTTSIIVSSILLAADEQLRVEKLSVVACADLVDRGGIQIDEERARDVFAIARLSEEGLEGATVNDVLCLGVGTTIGSKSMFEEV